MSWEKKPDGPESWGWGVEGALRSPDGSPDIAAYRRIAHRERDAAILAAVQDTGRSLRAVFWAGRGASGRMRPCEARAG
jgi:hypothetical protein